GLLEHAGQIGRRLGDEKRHRDRQLAVRGLLFAGRGHQLAGQDLLALGVAEGQLREHRFGAGIRAHRRGPRGHRNCGEPGGSDDPCSGGTDQRDPHRYRPPLESGFADTGEDARHLTRPRPDRPAAGARAARGMTPGIRCSSVGCWARLGPHLWCSARGGVSSRPPAALPRTPPVAVRGLRRPRPDGLSPNGALLATIPVGTAPTFLAIAPDGRRLYAASNGTLSVIDTAANSQVVRLNTN